MRQGRRAALSSSRRRLQAHFSLPSLMLLSLPLARSLLLLALQQAQAVGPPPTAGRLRLRQLLLQPLQHQMLSAHSSAAPCWQCFQQLCSS